MSQQLSSLQKLSSDWQQFEIHLVELQVALRGDHETLRMLDSALKGGSVSPDVATSMRDVAKVLSEKQDICCQVSNILIYIFNREKVILVFREGFTGGMSHADETGKNELQFSYIYKV